MFGKCPDWETRLIRHVQAEMGQPFAWRERDCNTFAVGCINAMAGKPLILPPLAYHNAETARIFAASHSLRKLMTAQLSAFPVRAELCQRGDIAFINRGGFECAHVVLGQHCAFPDRRAGVSLGNTRDLPLDAVFIRFQ